MTLPFSSLKVILGFKSVFFDWDLQSITDFDEISHTNSNGKVLKADAEMTLISISVGKSF